MHQTRCSGAFPQSLYLECRVRKIIKFKDTHQYDDSLFLAIASLFSFFHFSSSFETLTQDKTNVKKKKKTLTFCAQMKNRKLRDKVYKTAVACGRHLRSQFLSSFLSLSFIVGLELRKYPLKELRSDQPPGNCFHLSYHNTEMKSVITDGCYLKETKIDFLSPNVYFMHSKIIQSHGLRNEQTDIK